MKSEEIYQNLIELAEKLDITVSEQNLKISGMNVRSGLCKVRGKKMFIMSKHNKLPRKIELLATCLSAASTEEIYVIQDCWPVHFLPEVTRTACRLGITLVPLPTYSSWRNPIEKLWRWLRQAVLYMHPWADDWQRTKLEVARFLDRFLLPSPDLLRYVGLSY